MIFCNKLDISCSSRGDGVTLLGYKCYCNSQPGFEFEVAFLSPDETEPDYSSINICFLLLIESVAQVKFPAVILG